MSCTFQLSKAPEHLLQALHEVIPHCELMAQQLPETPISLWLIPPVFPTDRLDDELFAVSGMTRRIGFSVGHQAWRWLSGYLQSRTMLKIKWC